ncbi:DODA-type extradiol aromatic ring-opening family dioxygenase [Vibrio sp. WXL103]|uniref:DODA-type extradiol aromatic ring-opening family dioxygenase n=1 Tax=unclassified Vibrio TaxID=2614977 RepID=UPI003EC7B6BD
MNTKPFPALFISHGSPLMATDNSDTARFLEVLGRQLPKPDAILVFSAHFDLDGEVVITGNPNPAVIHDFYGFPEELYHLDYPAPGAPELAKQIVSTLVEGGVTARLDPQQGWDHGVWIPLRLLYPQADIPVVQVSISTQAGPEFNHHLGKLLAALRNERVLFIGSGGASHNLAEYFTPSPSPDRADKVNRFTHWVDEQLEKGYQQALLNYQELAPELSFNHPTQEHFTPLFPIIGSSTNHKAICLHHAIDNEVLAMNAYLFEQ